MAVAPDDVGAQLRVLRAEAQPHAVHEKRGRRQTEIGARHHPEVHAFGELRVAVTVERLRGEQVPGGQRAHLVSW